MALSCQTQLFCVADCIKDPAVAKVTAINFFDSWLENKIIVGNF